ncbi:hypothetical protein DLM75_10305 [Leptospira stimsonii]|uniref:Uncharacterized protein n=1 Tax=Leptospira stimsonii TaxID=2202203 RepID=A0A396ZAP6_9LEPT|nr:hypothetical protein DLM75_10305 [Leptospira stimsonii]
MIWLKRELNDSVICDSVGFRITQKAVSEIVSVKNEKQRIFCRLTNLYSRKKFELSITIYDSSL